MSDVAVPDALRARIDGPDWASLSELEAVEHIKKHLHDPIWRLNNLYWVRDDEGREVFFKLRAEQLEFLTTLHNRNLLVKGRQQGFSTLISLVQLDQALFNENFVAATICDTLTNATKMFRNKVRYPYERLPDWLRALFPLKIDNTNGFVFENGSSIEIGTSARSDTLQSLHVSEMGKISARFPEKAKEIVSGSFEAVTLSTGMIFIESTAEGENNEFHRLASVAHNLKLQGKTLTRLDFKSHFYGWFRKPINRLSPEEAMQTIISDKDREYFAKVEEHNPGLRLDPLQKAWYVKKAEELDTLMKREHPSWHDEAFEAIVEGSILEHEMTLLAKMGRIGSFPWVPQIPVHTFWDIKGTTAIWFMQRVHGLNRFIHYHEAHNMGFEYFVNYMNARGYVYGNHYLPHDGKTHVQGQHMDKPVDIIERLGMRRPEIVPRVQVKWNGVLILKPFLLTCEFDETGTKEGLRALRNYRRVFSEPKGGYVDEPFDDWAAHGTDAIRQAAQVGEIPSHETVPWTQMGITGPLPQLPAATYEVLDSATGF